MPFTENVMAAGSWSLDLNPGTPRAIRDAVDINLAAFSQLVICDVRVNPADLGDAGMLSAARYAGIYRGQARTGLTLSGAGMPVLMGDEDGKGNVIESPRSTANGFLSEWYASLTGPSAKVTAGTLTSPGGVYARSFHLVTYRQAWDAVCQRFGVEYRVNPDSTLDVGPVANLYGSTPATIILGRSATVGAGRDRLLMGIDGQVNLAQDAEDLTTKVVYATGDEASPTLTVAGGSHASLRSPDGALLLWERLVEAYNDDAATPADMAAAQLGRFNAMRVEWDVALADGYDVGRTSPVGSYVYLYDPASGLESTTPVAFRGAQVYPATSRLMSLETPIRAGMGVYLRRATSGSPVWTDLTPYVLAESGPQRMTVGALPRPSR